MRRGAVVNFKLRITNYELVVSCRLSVVSEERVAILPDLRGTNPVYLYSHRNGFRLSFGSRHKTLRRKCSEYPLCGAEDQIVLCTNHINHSSDNVRQERRNLKDAVVSVWISCALPGFFQFQITNYELRIRACREFAVSAAHIFLFHFLKLFV